MDLPSHAVLAMTSTYPNFAQDMDYPNLYFVHNIIIIVTSKCSLRLHLLHYALTSTMNGGLRICGCSACHAKEEIFCPFQNMGMQLVACSLVL